MTKHEMALMDPTGHTTITWDPAAPDEVSVAKKAFEEAVKKGYQAFHIRAGGQQGERMNTFNAEAERMVLVPQLRGG